MLFLLLLVIMIEKPVVNELIINIIVLCKYYNKNSLESFVFYYGIALFY
jgi:hypothetical protein